MSYVSNNAVYEFSDSTHGVPLRRNDRWTASSHIGIGKSKRSKGRLNPVAKGTTRGSKMKKARKRPR
jgi:hypothetical protein